MTTTDHRPADAPAIIEAVRALTPQISERAPAIEAARRIPPDLVDELTRAGCFRMALPASHGGAGGDVLTTMRMIETLARADASVGWIVLIGGLAWTDLVGLPRATFDEVFAEPDVIVAGAINPSGSIEATDGGFRVTGRWGFVSGIEHATVVFVNCIEAFENGEPNLRPAVLSPSEVTIEDTWTVMGLCGTGSHHIRVEDVIVPPERTYDLLAAMPCIDEPSARIPVPSLAGLCMASVAVGIAAGALDDITSLAGAKAPLFSAGPLSESPTFQVGLATADSDLRAARALLADSAEKAWRAAVEGDPFELELRAPLRAAAVWATRRAVSVVDFAYHAAGGGAVYSASPLQRRLRDIHALTQHFLLRPDTMTYAGAVLAGHEPEVPVF
jgi:alkylation response protein AidB-like acyl-CoA dehydrogenase